MSWQPGKRSKSYCTEIRLDLIAALTKERTHNAQLQRRIEEMTAGCDGSSESQEAVSKPIPRPSGTAGTDFSIQEAMGLAGNKQKYETYKALQVRLLSTYVCSLGELMAVLVLAA